MPIRKDFKTGEFCWIDLAAHDLKAAAAWYGELFGWKAVNLTPGHLTPPAESCCYHSQLQCLIYTYD